MFLTFQDGKFVFCINAQEKLCKFTISKNEPKRKEISVFMRDFSKMNQKRTRIFVDGKTLRDISEESGQTIDTVRSRYARGYRTYEELTAQSPHEVNISRHLEKTGIKKQYSMYDAGQRLMRKIIDNNLTITDIAKRCGVSRSTIYSFVYDGIDISSCRLAKLCRCVGVSTDYILGIKQTDMR